MIKFLKVLILTLWCTTITTAMASNGPYKAFIKGKTCTKNKMCVITTAAECEKAISSLAGKGYKDAKADIMVNPSKAAGCWYVWQLHLLKFNNLFAKPLVEAGDPVDVICKPCTYTQHPGAGNCAAKNLCDVTTAAECTTASKELLLEDHAPDVMDDGAKAPGCFYVTTLDKKSRLRFNKKVAGNTAKTGAMANNICKPCDSNVFTTATRARATPSHATPGYKPGDIGSRDHTTLSHQTAPPTRAAVDKTTKLRKGCDLPKSWGNGDCEDGNNNRVCGWDGGDCCKKYVSKSFCKVCKCLDPKSRYHPTAQLHKGCWTLAYRHDGHCDDGNNNALCDWDGGDCCAKVVSKLFCKACKCKDPKSPFHSAPWTPPALFTVNKERECYGEINNDRFCDPVNNNAHCGWDGGDCCVGYYPWYRLFTIDQYCGAKINKNDKGKCKCLNPRFTFGAPTKCKFPKRWRDYFCDDENNIADCGWDGGDCCWRKHSTERHKRCTKCKCRDLEMLRQTESSTSTTTFFERGRSTVPLHTRRHTTTTTTSTTSTTEDVVVVKG